MPRIPASPAQISIQQARYLQLHAQGLLAAPVAKPKPADLLACIERMGVLQIDTIHVVARSPYLVLFSRLGNYPVHWLEQALEQGRIFECWSHEACFAPTSAYALHQAHRAHGGRERHWANKHALRAHSSQRAGMDAVLEHIRQHGASKSSDFESARREPGGWWAWKDEKRWLEALFARGELMVARRERFQRVYDLSERVLERMQIETEAQMPPQEEVARQLILDTVRALGITQARWICDYFRTAPRLKDADLAPLLASGMLIPVSVSGWEQPAYVHRDHAEALQACMNGTLQATHTTLLSPFDPLVWDRERGQAMFDFDYTLECYVPEAKRRYGYFVLPVLHCGRIVARLDAKAHRDLGEFEIKQIHLQPGVEAATELAAGLAAAIRRCADWHATPKVRVRRSRPVGFAALLRKALQQV